ncbi:MAG: class E sortase [Acidimicrobiales bacterium]
MSFSTLRVTLGRIILVAGVLVLLFIPYLLWGTGVATSRAQEDLRRQFAAVQHLHQVATPVPPPVATAVAPVVAPVIPAPALGGPVGIISIPKIAVSMAVVEGTDAEQLRSGPGHYPGTPLPGESGNVAIAGHRTTYLHPFYDLDRLVPGDKINLVTVQGLFVYRVTSSRSVDPTDVSVVAPTPTPMLTLTTCSPRYSATQRLVVQADLVADVLTGTSPVVPIPGPASTPGVVARPAASPAPVHQQWWPAVLWGIAVAGLATAIWAAALRLRGARRGAIIVVGVTAWLVVVYAFFEALAPLLPASF